MTRKGQKQDSEKYEFELKGVEKRLVELEKQFITQLDGLLKRKVLTEQEFNRANEVARAQKAELEARRDELINLVSQVKAPEAVVEKIPRAFMTF